MRQARVRQSGRRVAARGTGCKAQRVLPVVLYYDLSTTVAVVTVENMSDCAPRAPTAVSVQTNTISDERCATLHTSDPSVVDAFLASDARHAYARARARTRASLSHFVGAGADLKAVVDTSSAALAPWRAVVWRDVRARYAGWLTPSADGTCRVQ